MDPINPAALDSNSIQPLHFGAPKDSVEQFNSLLIGKTSVMQSSTHALIPHQNGEKTMDGTLLEDTAKRLNKAEVALDELHWEIRKSTQPLGANAQLDSSLMNSITDLKYKTTAYFMNMMRTESGFSSLGEEAESITKRRGQ